MNKSFIALIALACSALAGCKAGPVNSPVHVRGDVIVDGKGVAGPVKVNDIPVTPAYKIDGHAEVVAQWPDLPYLTITGDYTTTVTSLAGAGLSPEQTPPQNVLIRVPHPAGQVKDQEMPAASPCVPAAPAAKAGCPGPIGESGSCSDGACPVQPSSAPPPAPSATPPASANGRVSASKFCGQAAPAAAAAASACAPKPAAAPAPCTMAAAAPKDCRPVYVSPCTGRASLEPPTAESWNRASLTGYHPGQMPWSPWEKCPQAAGLGEQTCARGVPAIIQGIVDLFTGRWV